MVRKKKWPSKCKFRQMDDRSTKTNIKIRLLEEGSLGEMLSWQKYYVKSLKAAPGVTNSDFARAETFREESFCPKRI